VPINRAETPEARTSEQIPNSFASFFGCDGGATVAMKVVDGTKVAEWIAVVNGHAT
jgi:hypothetical protein